MFPIRTVSGNRDSRGNLTTLFLRSAILAAGLWIVVRKKIALGNVQPIRTIE